MFIEGPSRFSYVKQGGTTTVPKGVWCNVGRGLSIALGVANALSTRKVRRPLSRRLRDVCALASTSDDRRSRGGRYRRCNGSAIYVPMVTRKISEAAVQTAYVVDGHISAIPTLLFTCRRGSLLATLPMANFLRWGAALGVRPSIQEQPFKLSRDT